MELALRVLKSGALGAGLAWLTGVPFLVALLLDSLLGVDSDWVYQLYPFIDRDPECPPGYTYDVVYESRLRERYGCVPN